MHIRCRRNQASLSAAEKQRYVAAVLALKANGTYDQYVLDHMNAMLDAHRGPAFLPWHREYLRRFEEDLRTIDPTVTLPYWDWTVDSSPTSSIWDSAFMGGNGRPSDGWVTSGPFAYATGNWTLVYDGPALRRRFGVSAPALPTPADLSTALAEAVYDVAPYDRFSPSGFRNRLEGWISGPQLHNLVHVWIGGSMGPMSSPSDPVFFLHHCFIDKIWADWQALHPGAGYLPVSGAAAGHNLGDAMQPWAGRGQVVTPASVLDHHALGYAYDTESICGGPLKFIHDRPTLKVFDDRPTLKFRDDIIPTLKFHDDLPTLKFRDDLPKLKFRDDPTTLKAIDDVKAQALDTPGTLKSIDDVKAPTLDEPRWSGKFRTDEIRPELRRGAEPPAPFVLSTPHHSMAWAQEHPEAFQAAVAQAEAEIADFAAAIVDREEAQQQGRLTEAEAEELPQLRQEYQRLIADYEQFVQGGPGEGGQRR